MTENLLSHSASPYLLQHKDNPVHWRPWGPEALAEAERAGKPILLSVGYAACHWCHVMAHESFEDPQTAAVMNRLFVNIKVDREERPDIDQIYMAALHALGEQGGWPLTMFLKPNGEPIWGGTYFPKDARYGRPGFVSVLNEVSRIFHEEPDKITHNARLLMEHLAAPQDSGTVTLNRDLLDRAAQRLLGLMDLDHGGLRGAPKFPMAGLLEFLWRSGLRTGRADFTDAVLVTLRNICQGGIYDHIGGGFSRYSVDDRWLVPHFEKMLYDNAQLIELLTYAHIATGERLFLTRIEETVAWLSRDMRLPGGAFAASLDADSEGEEGRFYVWTHAEIIAVLGPDDGPRFAEAYDIRPGGNWEGVSIPNRLADADSSRPEIPDLSDLRDRLLAQRNLRPRPGLDDKILADWNGLMIAALAFAGASLGRPAWIDLARSAYRFIRETLARGDRTAHSWRNGIPIFPGLATDYAALTKAALALHSATAEPTYLADAESLSAALRRHHWDDRRPGFFLAADDAEALIVRPRSETDEATPSANTLATQNLIRLYHLTGKNIYRTDADALIDASSGSIANNLFATIGMLNALDLRLGASDVVIIAPTADAATAMIAAARRHATPNLILTYYPDAAQLPQTNPAIGKTAIDNRPTAYVCRGETCSLPYLDPDRLASALASGSRS